MAKKCSGKSTKKIPIANKATVNKYSYEVKKPLKKK